MTSKARQKIKHERSRIREYWALKAAQLALLDPDAYTLILQGDPPRTDWVPHEVHWVASAVLDINRLKIGGARRFHRAVWQLGNPEWKP